MPKYIEVHPRLRGLRSERKARLLIPEDKILLMNDGDEGQGEVILITGQSFSLTESLEELAALVGTEVKPLQTLELVDGGEEE